MKNHKLIMTALLLAACSAFGFAYCEPSAIYAIQPIDKKEYVCPPCGCDKDKEVFDKAGACPTCGMGLVEKGSAASQPGSGQPDAERKKVAILIFNGVQIIDYTGPWEVFGQAGFEVFTIAQKPDPIITNFGMKVTPNHVFADSPKPDILLIPGGNVLEAQKDQPTLNWLRESAEKAEVVLSVCNGAYILAKAGLLNGLTATTTAPLIDGLAAAAPNIKVVYDKRYVDNGKVITTAGLSAGIDGSLHVISRLYGKGRAQAIALGMEYDWRPDSGFARAALADKRLRFALNGLTRIPLNSEGDMDGWESHYLIKGVSSAAEAFEHINTTLKAEGKWIRLAVEPAKEMTSFWTFTDEEGKPWNGRLDIQPAIGDKDRLLVSLKIARNAAKLSAPTSAPELNQIVIKDAWIQEGPPSQKVAAAFLVIENQGAADTALLSAKADVAGAVELHKMETAGEVMKMRRLDLIPVPAGSRTELQPAGLHLMLIGLSKPIKQGDEVSITLQFSNSAQKTFRVPVMKRDSAAN
jgi:copper(I)-binding protein/putative intracellular protease/amidase